MTTGQLMYLLSQFPKDAQVCIGTREGHDPVDQLPIFGLYSEIEAFYYHELRSCRSGLPSQNQIMKNVLVIENVG